MQRLFGLNQVPILGTEAENANQAATLSAPNDCVGADRGRPEGIQLITWLKCGLWRHLIIDKTAKNHRLENTPHIQCEKGQDEALEGPPGLLSPVRKNPTWRKLQSWRLGVAFSAWACATVLFINLVFMFVAVARFEIGNGLGTAYQGSCQGKCITCSAIDLRC